MKTLPVLTHASLEIVSRETLITIHVIELGVVERLSQVEKLRQQLQENNPDELYLIQYRQVINPNYSPLTDGQEKVV